ncbi:hypothetical protein A7982_12331 [Minicystis rosea]|nr:hypothetical protein A7982_12331 [Minicystis rosea]
MFAAGPDPESVQKAQVLYDAGLKQLDAKNYKDACPKFLESRRLDNTKIASLIALAKCHDQAGQTASAWARYRELTVEFKKLGNPDGEKAATHRADELEKVLSKLQINTTTDVPGLIVRRDGNDVSKAELGGPVNVDPGPHVIEATAPGYEVWQTTVTVGDKNDNRTVTIPGLTAKPTPTSPLRPAAFAVGGLGVAGLVLGGVMGGLAMSDKSKLDTLCPQNACPNGNGGQDKLASAKTKALVSTVGLSVGGAALATGVVLFVLSTRGTPKQDERKPALVPAIGPGFAGLSATGSF